MTAAKTPTGATTVSDSTLEVEDLRVTYLARNRAEHAVRGVSFAVQAGEILGIVGESGSGKSSIAHCLMRLTPPNARVTGKVVLGDLDIMALTKSQLSKVRGGRIGMIFQDPLAALNPVFPVSTQVIDTFKRHRPELSRQDRRRMTGELLESMDVPASRMDSFPHQLSGGMRQRALIAAAIAANPMFLVADEPTSDLDTISQGHILKLLRQLREDRDIGIVFISHDLGVVSALCDRIAVMQRGLIVEQGRRDEVLSDPKELYTQSLIQVSRRQQDADGNFITMAVGDSQSTQRSAAGGS